MSLKSDTGARAAWKGFSSQTVYIAYRLMVLKDELDMYPENIEDLMIKNNNEIKELIQIKNLNKELTLSHLNPKNKDSFFRRVLEHKSDSLKIKIISFGNIGFELEQLNKRKEDGIKSFKNKMLKDELTDFINICNIIFAEINKNEEYTNSTKQYIDLIKKQIESLDMYIKEKESNNLPDLKLLYELLIELIYVIE